VADQRAAASATAEFSATWEAIVENVERALRGKREAVELATTALVAGGHVLIEDVPGVGKTLLAKALAASIHATWSRVQFTPDLLPSDIIGVGVWEKRTGKLNFRPGPIFHHIVLGDEINRASPKTQSALLEAMEERQVTVDGVSHRLEEPFMVLATQNPVEFEGTYPLPEGQLDRFMLRVTLGYPDRHTEIAILEHHIDDDQFLHLEPVATTADVLALRDIAQEVFVAPALRSYLVDLADASRRHPDVAIGMSPRATLAVLRAARVRAAAAGREFVVPDDVQDLLAPTVAHRLTLTADARLDGAGEADVLADVLGSIPVPTRRSSSA